MIQSYGTDYCTILHFFLHLHLLLETRTKRIENIESKLLLFLRFISHLIIVVFWLRPNKIYVLFFSPI